MRDVRKRERQKVKGRHSCAKRMSQLERGNRRERVLYRIERDIYV